MATTNTAAWVVVLGGLVLGACGTESPMEVSAPATSSEAALGASGLADRDYYYLSYITSSLLAQREHSRLAAQYSTTRNIQEVANQTFGVRNAQLVRAQNLAASKGERVDLVLTPHQEHRVHKLSRHRYVFDFNHLYLVYMGDNLENTLDAATLAQSEVVDQDVRAFVSCLSDPLASDLQNIDTLLAGGTVNTGAGGGKGDGKGDADRRPGQQQGDKGDADQGQQQGGAFNCW